MKKVVFFLLILLSVYSCEKSSENELIRPAEIFIADKTWDFTIFHNESSFWHADVSFYKDGTAFYDEPLTPGSYATYGTWDLDGFVLTYQLDSSNDSNYIFTGLISENKINGTYTFGGETKNWNAIPK